MLTMRGKAFCKGYIVGVFLRQGAFFLNHGAGVSSMGEGPWAVFETGAGPEAFPTEESSR